MPTGPRIKPLDTAKKPHVIPATSWTNAAIVRERAEARRNRFITKEHAQEITVAARTHRETKQRPRSHFMSEEKAQALVHGVADEADRVSWALGAGARIERRKKLLKQAALEDLSSRFAAWRKRQ
jgi:hypothetical protein